MTQLYNHIGSEDPNNGQEVLRRAQKMPFMIFSIFFDRCKKVDESLEVRLFFTLFIRFKKPVILSHV